MFCHFPRFSPFCLHLFFLQIFSHIEDLCLVNERVQASSKDLNHINVNWHQHSQISFFQLLFLISIRREQDSTTSHFRVTRARSDSISRRSNLCLYFLLVVVKDFCSCALSVTCQVLCNFKDHNAEQALNTVWKNTAAAIRFSFFTLKTAWFKPMGLESSALPRQLSD